MIKVTLVLECQLCGEALEYVDVPTCKKGEAHKHVRCASCSPPGWAACLSHRITSGES